MNNVAHTNAIVLLNLNDLETLLDKAIKRNNYPIRESKEPISDNTVLTTKEVLSLLKISTHTLYSLRESGRLRPFKIGSKMLYKRSDVLAIMEDQL
jgi:excisionase family DNA binding protein